MPDSQIKTGDRVMFRASGTLWLEGIVDYIYANGTLVIKAQDEPPIYYERKPEEVQQL